MQARLIAYPTDAAAITRWLVPGDRLRIGRGGDCDLRLDDPSVSRAHAEVFASDGQWQVRDLGSKNGTLLDGVRVGEHRLPEAGWLRLGDVHCEFARFDDARAAGLRGLEDERRARSAVLTRQQQGAGTSLDNLLDEVLRGVLDLSGCSRGFLLLTRDDGLAVRAGMLADAQGVAPLEFTGSASAVRRALANRRPVVVNHMAADPWLAGRASVATGGLQSLVCLPLMDGTRAIGAVYADRTGPGEPITEVDLELLAAFAETATLWLLARRALESLQDAPRWGTLVLGREPDGNDAPGRS